MANLIIVIILLIIIGGAVAYIVKAKKSGVRCVGCPSGGNCSGKNNESSACNCGCHSDTKEETKIE